MEPPSNLLSTIKYSGINIKGKSEMVRVAGGGGEIESGEIGGGRSSAPIAAAAAPGSN